jgi:hypothetical protein
MGDYSTVLSFYRKTLEIKQKTLPTNHSSLAATYCNMATAFEGLHQFHLAVEYSERAVDTARQTLGPNHLHTQLFRDNLDRMRKKL